MDIANIPAELRQQRDQIDEAILSLERLARGRGQDAAGRQPGWPRPLGALRSCSKMGDAAGRAKTGY